MPEEIALIVGAGKGLSASLARLFHSEGMKVILAARNTEKIKTIASETKATLFKCDGSDIDQVENMFKQIEQVDKKVKQKNKILISLYIIIVELKLL